MADEQGQQQGTRYWTLIGNALASAGLVGLGKYLSYKTQNQALSDLIEMLGTGSAATLACFIGPVTRNGYLNNAYRFLAGMYLLPELGMATAQAADSICNTGLAASLKAKFADLASDGVVNSPTAPINHVLNGLTLTAGTASGLVGGGLELLATWDN